MDHPDDLARRLKVSRQSIDKHLLALHERGLVERSAVFPVDGRRSPPRRRPWDHLGEDLAAYCAAKLDEFRTSQKVLDDNLSSGTLDEEAYLKRRRALEKHYGEFLAMDREAKPGPR